MSCALQLGKGFVPGSIIMNVYPGGGAGAECLRLKSALAASISS